MSKKLREMDAQIQQHSEELADKANKTELQQISLAYKESYATLAALQTAYPSGDTHNHVVLADGMIYTYVNSAWTNTQVQGNGTGIADNSISTSKYIDKSITTQKLNDETITKDKLSGSSKVNSLNWELGTISSGNNSASTTRIRTVDYISFNKDDKINLNASGYYYGITFYNSSRVFQSAIVGQTADYTFAVDSIVRLVLYKTSNGDLSAQVDFDDCKSVLNITKTPAVSTDKIQNKAVTVDKVSDDFYEQLGNILYKPYWSKFATALSANFREDANGNLEAYTTTASTLTSNTISNLIDFSRNIRFEFEINVDTAKTFGAMVGFSDDAGTSRFLIGYEPAHGKIEFYYGAFYVLIESPTNGQYKFVIERDTDNNIIVYINGERFSINDYVSINATFTRVRIQLKATDLGLVVKNLKLKYIDSVQTSTPTIDTTGLKQYGQYGKISGKNVHVYQFGGKGNDWCFVRTPLDYDPDREKPYPFVICNHGNGWVMDGSLIKASWTKRTMYVLASDSDYIANPSQYNVVPSGDPLLYSNPTIEALLAAGYIVCGAENYGDNLYGNDNCRQACTDFYQHMIKNYNVEEKCYMIGASNGAMTSLNAMYLLGGVSRVKAMILQYPLTCLWRHYTNYSAHQAPIESAYGIAAGLTEAQFEKATRTHDPEKVCTITGVNGVSRFKTIPMPPIKIWYSLGDTVTVAANNALALIQLLEDSNCVHESVVATGEHGDYTHFDPTAYVNWFEKWR